MMENGASPLYRFDTIYSRNELCAYKLCTTVVKSKLTDSSSRSSQAIAGEEGRNSKAVFLGRVKGSSLEKAFLSMLSIMQTN